MSGPWEAYAQNSDRPRVEIRTDLIGKPATEAEGPWAAFAKPAPASFADRFGETQLATPSEPSPEMPAGSRVALDFMNQGSAASQRTTPNIEAHSKNFISDRVYENDAGDVLYEDPTTGKLLPTDQNKHVALRDPKDNKIKVFAREASTDEGVASSLGRLLGTGMASGAPTARAALSEAPKMVPKASELFSESKPLYRAFKEQASKVDVPAETAAGIGERLRGSLEKANLIPELAQPVYAAIGILDKGETTLDALQNVKRVIGRNFASPDKNVRDAAAVASGELMKVMKEVSPSAAKNLTTADEIHSSARAVQDLQRKSEVADLRKGRSGYGGNAVNAMRQVLSPIVEMSIKGKSTGFKPNEIAAMREIVEGTTATNALRNVGMMAPSKGSIPFLGGMSSAGTAGAMAAGPVGAAAAIIPPVVGSISNKLATVLTGKQVDRLKELVAKRSPAYAQAVEKAADKYQKAQLEFVSDPSPGRFAAYLTASRSLSSGLTRDGISVTSGDLLRALQGPIGGRTDDE